MSDSWNVVVEALPKSALYAGVLLSLGTTVVHRLLDAERGPAVAPVERWLARLARTAAFLVAAALALRVTAHTATAFGFSDFSFANLWIIGAESRWGSAWQRQLLAAALLVAASILIARRPSGRWRWHAGAAVLCAVSVPLLGHGAGSPFRIALHAFHVIVAGAWIGTLAVLTLAAVRERDGSAAAVIERLVGGFHLVALPSAALLTLTGLIASVLYVGSLDNLWATGYGRMLLAKLTAVAGAALCGWRNWQRVRQGRGLHLPTMTAELAFAAAVIVVTGVLTELEHT